MPVRSIASLGMCLVFLVSVIACAPVAAPSPTTSPAKADSQPTARTAPAQPVATQAVAKPAATPVEKARATPEVKAKANAKTQEDFYRGKTVRVIVGFAAGGGFDQYSRLIARYLGKHLPGNPNVIVENMPGAGSLIAANHIYNTAPQDGTVIGNIHGNLVNQQLFGAAGVEYDSEKWHILGVPTSDNYVMLARKDSGIGSLAETIGPSGKELVIGADAPGSANHDSPVILKEALGAKLKIVPGYQGSAKIRLGVEQNEVQAMFAGWESLRITSLDKFESGEWLLIGHMSEHPPRDMPPAPAVMDMATTDEARRLIRFGIMIPSRILRPYIMGPGVPEDRARMMREAFVKTMEDGELLAEAEKGRLDVSPVSAEETRNLIQEQLAMPGETRAKLKALLVPS